MEEKKEYKSKSLSRLKKQGEIRSYRGKLKWSGDLHKSRTNK